MLSMGVPICHQNEQTNYRATLERRDFLERNIERLEREIFLENYRENFFKGRFLTEGVRTADTEPELRCESGIMDHYTIVAHFFITRNLKCMENTLSGRLL